MQIHPSHAGSPHRAGFTLVELLAVITIIAILTALVLGTYKFVQDKGARARAETEIKAMEAALESYKADNGAYASTPANTDILDPKTDFDPTAAKYKKAGLDLYKALSGDADANQSTPPTTKVYFEFKDNQLSGTKGPTGYSAVAYIADPWGSPYGYSTIYAAQTAAGTPSPPTGGYNPTFDLWSTGGSTDTAKWLKNW